MPQAVLTLNLLRASRINPKLSAWAYLFGEFDYLKTPLATPGTKLLVHMKPQNRATYALNGEEGWSIGFSPEHYRCLKVYFPKTRSERNVDTVTFFPAAIPFPQVKLDDFLRQAATDIITILTAPPSTTTPALQAGDPTRNALLEIATVLNRVETMPLTTTNQLTLPPQTVKHVKKVSLSPTTKVTKKVNTEQAQRVKNHKKDLSWQRDDDQPVTHGYRLRSRSPTIEGYKSRAAKYLLAQHIFSHKAHHIYNENGKILSIGILLNGEHGELICMPTLSN